LQSYTLNIFVNSPVDSTSQKSKSKVSFGYGWNSKVSEGIKHCDIVQITGEMRSRGIETDFAGNQVIAWCSHQAVKVFDHMNERYGLKLGLPKGIYVRDFSQLKETPIDDYGRCNWYPAYLQSGANKIFPERTVFFNSFEKQTQTMSEGERWRYKWENVDPIIEEFHRNKILGSGHFLGMFLHEFCHSAHNKHIFERFEKLSPEDLLKKLRRLSGEEYPTQFGIKYGKLFSRVSKRASEASFEAVAEDMSTKIANSFDSSTLLPAYNPFKSSPYQDSSTNLTLVRILDLRTRNRVLKKVWNGEDLL